MTSEPARQAVAENPADHGPSQARLWHHLQGGHDFDESDRVAAVEMARLNPRIYEAAKKARDLLSRGVRFAAGEVGVGQFLDLGCGMPAPEAYPNVHELARESVPDARVVYVDNDPDVEATFGPMLDSDGADPLSVFVSRDAREIDGILSAASELLDLDEPVCVLIFGVLGAIAFDEAITMVETLFDRLAVGSHLMWEDGLGVGETARKANELRRELHVDRYEMRSLDEVRRYFDGLSLIDPGIVPAEFWKPATQPTTRWDGETIYGALAVKG